MIYDIYIYICIQNNEYVYFSFTAQSAFCSSENMVGCPTMTAVFFLEPFWHIKIWWKSCVHPQSLGWICAMMLLEKKKRVDLYESKRRNPGFGVPHYGGENPKMDGENHGKAYFLMDDLGRKPTIFGKHPFVCMKKKRIFNDWKRDF